MSATPITPGNDVYATGPVLPAELPKPPYRPAVAGRMAFFFGPVAGALVASINLRRMGKPVKAAKIRWITLLLMLPLAVIISVLPEATAKVFGVAIEAAGYALYSKIQDAEFTAWASANPGVAPSSGWAALGWGVLGLFVFVAIIFVVVMALYMMGVPIS